jgi:hypothetical protein
MRSHKKTLTIIKINSIKYRLGKVEKSQEEFGEVQKTLLEKIDKLLQK